MTTKRKSALDLVDKESPIHMHAAWYLQSLQAVGRAEATATLYLGAINELDKFLLKNDLPRTLADIRRDHLERFMLDQQSRLKTSSAAARHAGLRSFFKWATEQGQINANPMAQIMPPRIPEVSVPVLTDENVRAILAASEGRSFKARRDQALIRFLLDTGARRSEAAAVKVADLDLPTRQVTFKVTKGKRQRVGIVSAKTASAIYAYLIERDKSRHKSSPFLWLGQYGALSGDAVGAIFSRRARMAGVLNLCDDGKERPAHVHQARHTFADRYLAAGGSESNLMALGGWRSREIMSRYGRARATERALEEATRIAVGDRY